MSSNEPSGLSSSMKAALKDPRLSGSLKDVRQEHSGYHKETRRVARLDFQKKVKRYFMQLSQGCGDRDCHHRLCASCTTGPRLTPAAAAVMAVQLAGRQKAFICQRIPQEPLLALPESILRSSPFNSPNTSPRMTPAHSRLPSGLSPHHKPTSEAIDIPRTSDTPSDGSAVHPISHILSASPFGSLFHSFTANRLANEASPPNFASRSAISKFPSFIDINDDSAMTSRSFGVLPSLLTAKLNVQPLVDEHHSESTRMRSSSFASLLSTDTLEASHEELVAPDEHFPQLSLDHLTLKLLEVSLETYTCFSKDDSQPDASVGDPSFVLNTIRTVFSSAEAMSKSFLCETDDQQQSHPSKLDLESICRSYQLIIGTEPEDVFKNTLMNAIEVLLAKFMRNSKRMEKAEPSILRVLLVLLLNPLLTDSVYVEFVMKLCVVVGMVGSSARQVLVSWFCRLEKPVFERIVSIFKQYLISRMNMGHIGEDQPWMGAIKTLSLLNQANEKSRLITPFTTFQIPEIASKLDFKKEYRIWRRFLDPNDSVEFSIFDNSFIFDPISKTRILHIDARIQMSTQFEGAYVQQALVHHAQRFLEDSEAIANLEEKTRADQNPYLIIEVRREQIIQDSLDQIQKKAADLKKPLKVRFVNGGEEGQDQGGVQKEFFQVLIANLLDPSYGMFTYEDSERISWINRLSFESDCQFELVGIILGLALYNGVMLAVQFPLLLYKKLLDIETNFDDFEEAFPVLAKGLKQLLEWKDGDVSEVFMRNFEISYDVYGKVKTYPLVKNGENIPVTNSNRVEYVQLYIRHYIHLTVAKQFTAFKSGFHKVVGGEALRLCRPEELELLICGHASTELDFGELEQAATYDDGYSEHHTVIRWFWEVVHTMTMGQKKKLLSFVTSSDRVPLKGFGSVTFVIQRNGPDTNRLPTALTCFGRLLLPEYSSKEKLADRVLTAIENAKGFGLV